MVRGVVRGALVHALVNQRLSEYQPQSDDDALAEGGWHGGKRVNRGTGEVFQIFDPKQSDPLEGMWSMLRWT